MVWAGFSSFGKLEIAFVTCRMNSNGYQDVLRDHLLPFLHAQGGNWTFQHDNASIHASRHTAAWLQSHQINVLPWPACSPDLNPIENLWSIIVRDVYKDCRQYNNVDDLKRAILDAWRRVPLSTLQNLVDSMPRRLLDVVAARGGTTNY